MHFKITFVLFILSTLLSFAQSDIESIGFSYGYSGGRSTLIGEAEQKIEQKDYQSIIELLKSTSIADQFIGSILCTLLAENDKIVLTENQSEKILLIQMSSEVLEFRAGCTCQDRLSLANYFSGKNPCRFRSAMASWMTRLTDDYF